MKFYKNMFGSTNHFLYKNRFLDLKKNLEKPEKKTNKKSQDRKGTLAQARPPARPTHKITRVPFRTLGDLISTSEL